MANSVDPTVYEWHPCSLVFPRIGKVMDRNGLHTRLIMPGAYYIRRSRSLGHWIYRHRID